MSAADVDVGALEALLLNSGVAPERARQLIDALLEASGRDVGLQEREIPPALAASLEATLSSLRRESRLSADSLRLALMNFRIETRRDRRAFVRDQRWLLALLLAIFVTLWAVIAFLVFDPFARENMCDTRTVDKIDNTFAPPAGQHASPEGV